MNDLYCNLMEDIKRRSDVIKNVIEKKVPLPNIIAFELCYLQLRKICELIARGCLAAHGDIPESRNQLGGEYNANKIIKRLEALHPTFYPQPSQQVHDDAGKVREVKAVTEGYLSKTEFLRLYGECGEVLHEPTLEKRVVGSGLTIDYERINDWCGKIRTLLNHHQIQLRDDAKQLWVLMQSKDDGKVHAFQMLKQDGPLPTPGPS
ncbi:MAG: hypothetical protein EPO08_13030 [Rhodospirillaceae bacterium]|nr:MAG: hypothetical protein EPO08_13030 [Rhodospirillaceae bacterium]